MSLKKTKLIANWGKSKVDVIYQDHNKNGVIIIDSKCVKANNKMGVTILFFLYWYLD